MKILNWSIWLFILILVACKGESPKDELDIRYDKVMSIHDEVMPKMRDINRAVKGLKKIEGYAENPLIVDKIKELEDADEAMMSWMAAFKKPGKQDLEAAKTYYDQQLDEISEVRDLMLGSIESAHQIIQQNTPQE